MDPSEWTHGASCYANHKCRCDVCRTGHRERLRTRATERRDETPPPDSHGKVTTYTNWGCRCAACTEANSTYNRNLRKRKQTRRMMSENVSENIEVDAEHVHRRGHAVLLLDEFDEFVAVGIRITGHEAVYIRPDGTLLPVGSLPAGSRLLSLGADSAAFLLHVAAFGKGLAVALRKCPPDAEIRTATNFRFDIMVSSASTSKETEE